MERLIEKTEKETFWGTSPYAGPWLRLAQAVSAVANPLFVALPTFLFIALYTAPDTLRALLWWAVTVGGISAAPFLFILRGVRLGHYSDHHVSIREQRLIPLLFGLGCMGSAFVLLLLLQVSRLLIATIIAVLVVCVIATVITRYWKISLHLAGIAGAVTVFGLVLGPAFFLLSPLVALVGWARWLVRAHTPAQALAGTALAVGVTAAVFGLFGIL